MAEPSRASFALAHVIVGTAGHVDHGKTSLVKALTGIDTDRLPEEKRRGITLELGFAHLDLPGGQRVGVVDVPGHERFVKAMAAGAGGIDVAMLVVAADEGVMPQTREHVDICALLGVRRGVLVVTKADLLPGLGEGWLELLEAELRALVAGTFLEDAKLVTVCAKTGEGLDGLKAELARLVDELSAPPDKVSAAGGEDDHAQPRAGFARERAPDGPLFLPIDRAFTVKGFGLVVTGTLLSGRLSTKDEVALLPGLRGPWRVRGLQVHGAAVDSASAGERVAVNLPELEVAQVHRGLALVRAGELPEAKALDVEVMLLPSVDAPLARRTRQLVTLGTAQVEGVLRLLDVEALRPGERCFAQLRFAVPVAAMPQQRFILRGTRALAGRGATVGGGRVLAVNPPRRRRGAAERLEAFAEAPLDERIRHLLVEAGYAGLTEAELFARASAPAKELARALEAAGSRGRVVLVDRDARRYLSKEVLEALEARALAQLERFHAENAEKDGMSREELRQRLGVPHEKTFHRLLAALVEAKRADAAGELVRLPGRGRTFDAQAAGLKDLVAAVLTKTALAPPAVSELAHQVKAPPERVTELLRTLVSEGRAVRAGEHFFDAGAVRALQARLLTFLAEKERITTQELKDLIGQSRKYVIPLAEYFDREKITLRVGETRVARKR